MIEHVKGDNMFMIKMSLRHLYRDLRELGIYPDIIRKCEDVKKINIIGSGTYPLNRYYGCSIKIIISDGYYVEFYDMIGRLHNPVGPAKFCTSGYITYCEIIINSILSGKHYHHSFLNVKWYVHGKEMVGGVPDNMFLKLDINDILIKTHVCGNYIIINGSYVMRLYHPLSYNNVNIIFGDRYYTIYNHHKYGRTEVRVLYNGSTCYERYDDGNVITDIHYKNGNMIYHGIKACKRIC